MKNPKKRASYGVTEIYPLPCVPARQGSELRPAGIRGAYRVLWLSGFSYKPYRRGSWAIPL